MYLYLANLTNVGSYKLSNTDGNFHFLGDTDNAVEVDLESVSGASHISTDQSGSLEVLELIERKKLILSFDKIVLQGRFDSEKEIELTDGKLNINVETLNQE